MKQWWLVIFLAAVLIGLAAYDVVKPFSSDLSPAPAQEIITGVSNTTYSNSALSFAMFYPSTATSSAVDYAGYLPVTQTPLTSFVLPNNLFKGTNLGEAGVYLGATTSPEIVASCTKPSEEFGEKSQGTTNINGADFAIFTASDAGAGNFYETRSYRTTVKDTCLEIVEMLHSANIGNFPPDTVTAFDHDKFSGILEAIVGTFSPLAP